RRVRIMNIKLDVPVGEYREFTEKELKTLHLLLEDSTKIHEAKIAKDSPSRSNRPVKDTPTKDRAKPKDQPSRESSKGERPNRERPIRNRRKDH
ncbi:MAG: hypothetical protein WBC43_03905, partial [Olleya sp.]